MIPPLCVIQARWKSTRLPGKMCMTLGSETLIARAHRIACEAFGKDNVIVAIPIGDVISPLAEEIDRIDARMIAWDGDENDVLGRFHHVAHRFRWHPESVIVRYTPDDPFKTVDGLRRVAAGERLPVEVGGEAFTLAMLDDANARLCKDDAVHAVADRYRTGWQRYQEWCARVEHQREHITYALFDTLPPSCPPGDGWTIDTEADLEAARMRLLCSAPAKRLAASVDAFIVGRYTDA